MMGNTKACLHVFKRAYEACCSHKQGETEDREQKQ